MMEHPDNAQPGLKVTPGMIHRLTQEHAELQAKLQAALDWIDTYGQAARQYRDTPLFTTGRDRVLAAGRDLLARIEGKS